MIVVEADAFRAEARQLTADDVCAHLLALSIVEYSYNQDVVITIDLGPAWGTIADTGRGIRLTPDPGDGISHAERVLTRDYPCIPRSVDIDAVLRELVWQRRGPQGPALANAACPFLRFVSERDEQVWAQSYRYGAPDGPPSFLGTTARTGTTITFGTQAAVDGAVIGELVGNLQRRISGLRINLRRVKEEL